MPNVTQLISFCECLFHEVVFALARCWGWGECILTAVCNVPAGGLSLHQTGTTLAHKHVRAHRRNRLDHSHISKIRRREACEQRIKERKKKVSWAGDKTGDRERPRGSWTHVWKSRCTQKGWCMWWRGGWAPQCRSPLWSGREPCGRLSGCNWPTGGAGSDGPAGCPGTWTHMIISRTPRTDSELRITRQRQTSVLSQSCTLILCSSQKKQRP